MKNLQSYAVLALLVVGCSGPGNDDGAAPTSEELRGARSWAPWHRRERAIIPQALEIPTLAYDDTSVLLVWHKPDDYSNVVDYNVYMDGALLGSADANNAATSPAKPYINAFYAADVAQFHVKARTHNYTVTGLSPHSWHIFTVRSLLADGRESDDSWPLLMRTKRTPPLVDVTSYGAVGDGTTLNTTAIQAAIHACPFDGKVLVPAGTFLTGALFLKSHMTFEVADGATLRGSANGDDYPLAQGYYLYDYLTDRRPPSLLNAIDQNNETTGAFENIRIVGRGTIDGNGWLTGTVPSVTDEIGNTLPQYRASSASKVATDGVLAKDQVAKAVANGVVLATAYSNNRSSLITVRGVHNIYYGGFSIVNPAYHGIVNLNSDNVVLSSIAYHTYNANNGDGVEFGDSNQIIVVNNFFDTGDDCVNFAAGLGAAASAQNPSQNAWIFDNYFRKGHGAVVAGSHTGAWIQNILAEDNVTNSTDVGLRMKSAVQNGGGARNVVFRDTAMANATAQGFIFSLSYTLTNNTFVSAEPPAQFSEILVQNVTVNGGSTAIQCDGFNAATATQNVENYPDVYNEAITFQDVMLNNMKPTKIDHLKDSTFQDVIFTNVVGGVNPWLITNSPNLQFTGTTTPLPPP